MDNKVSIWISKEIVRETDEDEVDVLKDLCGVEDYDVDNQEAYFVDGELTSVRDLLKPLSYSESFTKVVLEKAKQLGVKKGGYILAQYDFLYNIDKIEKEVAEDPIFIGAFDYLEDEVYDEE